MTVRQEIKDGYRQALLDRVTSVEGRVYDQRRPRIAKGSTPCVSLYLGDASMNPITQSFPRVIENRMELIVLGYSDAPSETVDTVLEELAEEIDTAMYSDWRQGGRVKSLNPTRIRLPDPADRDQPQGLIALGYEVTFHTVESKLGTSR
jgi:hypothetical protein